MWALHRTGTRAGTSTSGIPASDGGWFRIGNRANEGHAEMSACINLPDGRTAFFFERPKISNNTLRAGNQKLGDPRPLACEPGLLFRRSTRARRCMEPECT